MSAEITTFLYRVFNYWKEQWGLPLATACTGDRGTGRSEQDFGLSSNLCTACVGLSPVVMEGALITDILCQPMHNLAAMVRAYLPAVPSALSSGAIVGRREPS